MSLTNVYAFSAAGDSYNEDAFAFGDNFAVVIDGATGLNKIHLSAGTTDAGWMARHLATLLKERLHNTWDPIETILKDCAAAIQSELDHMGYDSYRQSYPSACVSVLRVNAHALECFYLGDCPILLLPASDRSIKILWDNAVPERDKKVVEWICRESARRGISVSAASRYAADRLRKNRQEMNTPDSYWIFEPTGAGIPHIKRFTCSPKEYSAAILMSDGFFDSINLFQIAACSPDLFASFGAGSAEEIYRKMRQIQMNDEEFDQFPRLKKADDATAIYVEIR